MWALRSSERLPVGVIDGEVKADDVGDEWRDGGVPSKPIAWFRALRRAGVGGSLGGEMGRDQMAGEAV